MYLSSSLYTLAKEHKVGRGHYVFNDPPPQMYRKFLSYRGRKFLKYPSRAYTRGYKIPN